MKRGAFIFLVLLCAATPARADIVTGLVAHWKLDGNATDYSGKGNDGTVTGATATVDRFGRANKALSFNGSAQYVTFDQNLLDGATAGTVSLWFNRGAWTEAYTTLFTKSIGAGWNSNHIQISENSTADSISLTISNNSSSTTTSVVTGNINQGVWYNVAMTWDGSVLIGYLNGSEIGRTNTTITLPSDSTRVAIGRGAVGTNRYFIGLIDDVRIYARALIASDVVQLYNNGGPTTLKRAVIHNATFH